MFSFDPGPLRFGAFEFDPSSRELRRRGLKVRVTPQAATLLSVLVEQTVRMRTREEIFGGQHANCDFVIEKM